MTSVTDDLPLAAEFPQGSYDDWKKLVDGVLKVRPGAKVAIAKPQAAAASGSAGTAK